MHINILFIANLLYALLSNSGCYAAESIPGYEYVGLGKCVGANGLGAFYPSLKISADTFDPNDWEVDCATYCNNFRSIGESFRGFDISGYYGCQCRFDAGVTEDLLSPIYMSMENEVVWKHQQLNFVEETGDIITSSNFDGNDDGLNFYCYKVVPFESPLIADEDTECVDTLDYEDQWGGICVEYESNAAWCGGYGEMGESGLTPNENCCVCKSKLVSSAAVVIVEDTIASVSSPCFGADDSGCINYNDFGECAQYGTLGNAVRAYVDQDCANNQECEIGQTYGWPMNSWCVKNVTDMSFLFADMETFNDDINGWNTSSVTNMTSMFWYATSFNGDLSNFDTSSVTDMDTMFTGASSFNGDVSSFDTSSVTNMYRMFRGATSFNQNVSNFDTSSVTNMSFMFSGATSFNQDLCLWRDNIPYTNAFNMFTDSGCTYQDTPQEDHKGPFCSSTCVAAVYPGDVEGFDYVGIGNCRDSGEHSYPSVTQIYTFSTEECADFCMKVGVDQSLGVLRGYVWGGDISGGLQIHCNCWFDSGANTEAIASQYGGEREHWGIMEPARFSTEGQGNGIISGTAESDCEVYCYKVIDQTVDSETATSEEEPWEVEETSPLSTDTPSKQMTFPPYSFDSTFFSSSNTPTVAVCPEEEAAFQSCITVDEDNIGSFVDCSLCGLEAMGDDIFDFSGYCERWDSCVSEMCPADCVEPINAYQRCILDDSGILDLVDCFNSDSVTDPITGSTDTEALPTDNMSPIPTTANDGIDDQFCLEETKALEECGIYDIDNLDMAEACAMCQVEAMGDDIMNFNTDSFCNKWKACANEKCPAACIAPMNDLQVCMFQDTGMTVDCLSSPDNANADNVVNEVESKAQRRQVITAVMIMGICGVIFA